MAFHTIYDIQVDGCRDGVLAILMGLLALYAGISWYRGRKWASPDGKTQAGYSPKVASFFFGALATLTFVLTWGTYWSLTRALEKGEFDTLQGPISNFHPAASIKDTEGFEISGHAFSYSKYAVSQGFHTLRLEGSPLKNGTVVHVHYVREHIVRLEIAQ
jgi:hypothetical protein